MEIQLVINKIFEVRHSRVILDFHLAQMYQIENRALKQAVRRNMERFPDDFMFRLTKEEFKLLINNGVSQNVIPAGYNAGASEAFAFTEQGVAMLSSILRSEIAVKINISIMRAFVHMREIAMGYAELKAQLENFMAETNVQFSDIYRALTELAEQKKLEEKPRSEIGYNAILKRREQDNIEFN